jgi:hypothetical protein
MAEINLSNNNNNNQTTQFFSIENSSNPELGNQIRQEIDILALKFIELDDQERSIKRDKKSIILELADKFERLHEIGELPVPIHRIGAYIYRYLQRKGFNVSDQYIRDVLKENAPQYLNSTFSYEKPNSLDNDIKVYQDEVMEIINKLVDVKYELLKREQVQELITKFYECLDTSETYADEHNIIAVPSGAVTEPHFDSEELDPFRDQITTDKPDPRLTPAPLATATIQLGESIENCGKTIKATGKMMLDYPPAETDREMEVEAVGRVYEWKSFWDALTQAMKPGTDRKYRRSILQWYKAAIDEEMWGKHASSSKNPYLAKFRDPKTGEIRTEIRKLTREQLGDRAPKIREFALLFKKTVPACLDMIFWAENYLNEWTNGLSVKLSDKLSDRSLR